MAGGTSPITYKRGASTPISRKESRSHTGVLRSPCYETYNPPRMGIALSIADLLVLLTIVISVSRAVRNGQSGGFGPLLLSICIVLAMLIFALVSFAAASGLAQSSSLNQGFLLAFLVVTAIVARFSWASKA
jgi:hypothetical protein